MTREVQLIQQCLNHGTDNIEQIPIGKIKETAEGDLNVVPAISEGAEGIRSVISCAFRALEKEFTATKLEAERGLFNSKQAYEYVIIGGEYDTPIPQADELGRRYYGFSGDTLELIGQPGQLGMHQGLVAPLVKMQEHLRELLEATDRYEAIRNSILEQATQAEGARIRTIDQANLISGDL